MWLKQSTAVTLKLGPFVDDTDGKTAETALTISQADVRLSKNGGDMAQKNEATSATHDEIGYYDVPLDATDTNTLGRLRVMVHESGALPVWMDFMVVPANVWDSLFGADTLKTEVVEISGDTVAADNLEAEFDGTGYKSYLRRATAQAGAAGTITLDASASATDDLFNGCLVAIISGTGFGQARFISDYVGSTKVATITPNWITNPSSDSVFLILPRGRVDVGFLAGTAQTAGDLAALINTIDDFLDTEIAAIKAKTDNLPSDPADASDIAAALTIIDDFLDTEIAAIKAKTDLIPAAPAAVGDIPTANANADALLDRAAGVETSWTIRQAMRILLAVAAGKLSGAATTTVAIRDMADSKDRISATVDASGNRSAVTRDAT
ncbi:MAG: hypothetical protein HOO67_06215 [Candidatus Peribacteraceae bacterium]|nr:hypothetical protein [Candidatus Peribacteraceae bacterium]